MRAIIGLVKGGIIGGALGFGFMKLGLAGASVLHYLLYGLIGAAVGVVAGKPFWRHETLWTPIIKAIFGAGVGIGLYALVVKALGDPSLSFAGLDQHISEVPYALGAAVGAVYGVFVEVDDGGHKDQANKPATPTR